MCFLHPPKKNNPPGGAHPVLRWCFSDSEEKESTKEDNVAHLNFHLKYEADLLFTR